MPKSPPLPLSSEVALSRIVPRIVIVRHQKERISKCSLRHLHHKEGVVFYSYPSMKSVDASSFVDSLRLDFEGPQLSPSDRSKPLLLIDATWRLAGKMLHHPAYANLEKRSLDPRWRTAYGRHQNGCTDPERGLASIEALYAARLQQASEEIELLEGYFWKEPFLELNADLIAHFRNLAL